MNNSDTTHFNEAIYGYFKYRDLLWDANGILSLPCKGYSDVMVNLRGQIQIEGAYVQLDEIRPQTFDFLVNTTNYIGLSMKKEINDSKGNPRKISTGFFEISFIKDSCPNLYFTIREVALALSDYKQFLIEDWFPNNEQLQTEN